MLSYLDGITLTSQQHHGYSRSGSIALSATEFASAFRRLIITFMRGMCSTTDLPLSSQSPGKYIKIYNRKIHSSPDPMQKLVDRTDNCRKAWQCKVNGLLCCLRRKTSKQTPKGVNIKKYELKEETNRKGFLKIMQNCTQISFLIFLETLPPNQIDLNCNALPLSFSCFRSNTWAIFLCRIRLFCPIYLNIWWRLRS